MSIAGILASHAYQHDFTQLTSALSSNDLAGARQAFRSLNDAQDVTRSAVSSALDPVQADLHDLSAALQAGDVKGAQTAFTRLQEDLALAQANASSGQSTVSLLG